MEDVAKIKAATDPAMVQVFTYRGAGHAFNRDGAAAWHGESARSPASGRSRSCASMSGRAVALHLSPVTTLAQSAAPR